MKVGDLADGFVVVAKENDSIPPAETPVENPLPQHSLMIINPDDPYDIPEERAEANDFIYNTFCKWSGSCGLFSTWRERHITLRGFRSGFGTSLFAKFTDCPKMWEDEGQYYEFGQEVGYVFKVGFQIGAVFVATQLGVIGFLVGGGDVGTAIELNNEHIKNILEQIIGMVFK